MLRTDVFRKELLIWPKRNHCNTFLINHSSLALSICRFNKALAISHYIVTFWHWRHKISNSKCTCKVSRWQKSLAITALDLLFVTMARDHQHCSVYNFLKMWNRVVLTSIYNSQQNKYKSQHNILVVNLNTFKSNGFQTFEKERNSIV